MEEQLRGPGKEGRGDGEFIAHGVIEHGTEKLTPEHEAGGLLRDQNEDAGEHGGSGAEFARAGNLSLFASLLAAMLGCFLGLVVVGHG